MTMELLQHCTPRETGSTIYNPSLLKCLIEFLAKNLKASRKSLYSIALTCRSLSGPALNALWETLDNILPLLSLLSPFKLINGFYVFQGPFHENDWKRFDRYSCRVKKLVSFKDPPTIAQSTYFRLAQLQPVVLPALEELESKSTTESDVNLMLFLSPNLKRLNIGGDQIIFDKLIRPALSVLSYEYIQGNSSLTHLTLRGQLSTHLSGLFSRFLNLRYLDVSGIINAQNFEELGKLENLESIKVQLSEFLSLQDKKLGFEQLRFLDITSTFPSCLVVLKNIATTSLESIVINAIPTSEESRAASTPKTKKSSVLPRFLNRWRVVVETINSRWHSTVRSLTINQAEVSRIVTDSTPSDLFSALPPFQHLQCLKIQRCVFHPFDKGIYLLALACPNITTLHLPLECVTAYTPSVTKVSSDATSIPSGLSGTSTTIMALWLLCDLCPRLKDLQMSLDVTDLPPFSNTTVRSHHLARLSISSYNINSYNTIIEGESRILNIARHIDRLFPHLETIVSHPLYGAETWDRVRPIISAYKTVRLDDAIRRLPSETSQQKSLLVEPGSQ